MSIQRRILRPMSLLIVAGLLTGLWISGAAIHTHDRMRENSQRAYATLERAQRAQGAFEALNRSVDEVLSFTRLVHPHDLREDFIARSDELLQEIGGLASAQIGPMPSRTVAELEERARLWVDEAAIAVGVTQAAEIPTRWYLRRLSEQIADAIAATERAAQVNADNVAVQARERFVWKIGLALLGMAGVFAIVASLALHRARALIRSLRRVAGAMEHIRAGRFDTEVVDRSRADEIGDMARGVVAFADGLRELTTTKERIEHMAMHDALTGLGNRRAMQSHLDRLYVGSRGRLQQVAVLHVDLDRFKHVNDTMGHDAGDQLLCAVAKAMRESVWANDLIARVGGDEFVIVLARIQSRADAATVARRVIEAISLPVTLEAGTAQIGASIGIAFGGAECDDAERLLLNADVALYAAKAAGRGRFCFYSPGTRREFARRENLVGALREGMKRGEIEVMFQPQVNGIDGALVGIEALARWRHPERGLLAPAEFLDIAFENGLGDQLSEAVLSQAAYALREWRDVGLPAPRVNVNLSGRQLRDPGVVELMRIVVSEYGLRPDDFAIEIVESVLFGDSVDPALANIAALQALGFSIELDDFGTGHASISNLKRFKVDRIKLDRGFVARIDVEAEQEMIVKALIDLSDNLGIGCLAEGVETEAERSKLIALGCALFQGQLIAAPMGFAAATDWLRRHGQDVAADCSEALA